MTSETLHLIKRKKWLIFWLAVLGAFLAFDLMVIQAPEYKATAKVLVIQKQTIGQDVYSVSKSAQMLSKILKESIYSDDFFNKVVESPYRVDAGDFPENSKDRRKEWEKTVKINIVRDLGVMEFGILHRSEEKAEHISRAIVDVLENNHQLYHGAGSAVTIKALDYPTVGEKPVNTHIYIGTVLGALIGMLIGLGWTLRKVL